MSEPLAPCGECGMPCTATEYHPYAACLMFKQCKNSRIVRDNLMSSEVAWRDVLIDQLRQQLAAAIAERDRAVGLLREVVECFTRDDDLPNELLPRISAAIAAGGEENNDGR